jgi:hypothetical protein
LNAVFEPAGTKKSATKSAVPMASSAHAAIRVIGDGFPVSWAAEMRMNPPTPNIRMPHSERMWIVGVICTPRLERRG